MRHCCVLEPAGPARVRVKKVRLEPDQVIAWVALRRKNLVCPKSSYSTIARENEQDHDSVWPPGCR